MAHNGKKFDYPILLSELKNIDKYLAEDILCADTYHLFKDYFTKGSHNQEVDISMVGKHVENISINQKPPNFKLITIYEHLLKVPVTNSHDAQSDCINMLKCVSCIKEYFVEWCDSNAEPLLKMKIN